jgi:hypothetical protein
MLTPRGVRGQLTPALRFVGLRRYTSVRGIDDQRRVSIEFPLDHVL